MGAFFLILAHFALDFHLLEKISLRKRRDFLQKAAKEGAYWMLYLWMRHYIAFFMCLFYDAYWAADRIASVKAYYDGKNSFLSRQYKLYRAIDCQII